MSKKIIVYTQPECPPCQIVKQFLQHYNFSFEEIDITKNEEARLTLINEFKATSTPTVTIDDEIVIGFNLQKLEHLLNIEA
ncbi:glutaredoxin domain-containing protein [Metabacillus fastidiosus]|uniref:Glutaredoxin domain-containing protein n=1 Tax=Metabacillus fastidiosus TaxID=1458 RepID=A0ABU6P3A5_9BACI|nr:glutaredoxin domain-containing protein [Metabacillus fastidiosus]MED4403771.1 glutaredoxin domain-containing protein [Metabacillus fastidiosus]MED4463519.1 glutaredoxin domain-containing protein [Metabacillus fastidiosus]